MTQFCKRARHLTVGTGALNWVMKSVFSRITNFSITSEWLDVKTVVSSKIKSGLKKNEAF